MYDLLNKFETKNYVGVFDTKFAFEGYSRFPFRTIRIYKVGKKLD